MTLTGKTIGELAQLSSVTENTLFAVEYSGKTFNLPYSAFSPTYKVYTALLVQTGTTAPIDTVLENTLGEVPLWDNISTGVYQMTITSGIFIREKTFISGFGTWVGNGNPHSVLSNGNEIIGYYTLYQIDDNNIGMEVFDSNFLFTSLYDLIGGTNLFLEIKVYN